MSTLKLRYANVGSLSNLSLSIYDSYLIPANYLMAILLMFSKAIFGFIVYGCHTAMEQFRCDLTIVL